jgi:hypothetical protein
MGKEEIVRRIIVCLSSMVLVFSACTWGNPPSKPPEKTNNNHNHQIELSQIGSPQPFIGSRDGWFLAHPGPQPQHK